MTFRTLIENEARVDYHAMSRDAGGWGGAIKSLNFKSTREQKYGEKKLILFSITRQFFSLRECCAYDIPI